MSLYYYAHRFRNGGALSVAEGSSNLMKAMARYEGMVEKWAAQHPDRVLSAPWIDLVLAGVSEWEAWSAIVPFVAICQGIVLDMDGETGYSAGMWRESELAKTLGKKVEEVA
jgi:hypothetical protein